MPKIKGLIILLGIVLGSFSFPIWALQFDQRPILPIPNNPPLSKAEKKLIALGHQLFNDTHLSPRHHFSCATCHALKSGGTVARPPGHLKIPSILNAQYNFKQFWNARSDTLEEAIKSHLLNSSIMGFNPQKDIKNLIKNQTYPANLNFEQVIHGLTAYVKILNTPHSRFDDYLAGKPTLSDGEKKGFALFQSYGCIACHQGRLVGGNILQKFGIYTDYLSKKPHLQSFDQGYFEVTQNINDRFVFKVPSLRNVALKAPYFHDSSVNNLHSAVETMGLYQLGHSIPAEDVKLIVQFLNTLTGQIPEK